MSLNKLLIEGKIAEGLDLEIRSISTATGAGNLIRGDLTVIGSTDLQGNTTVEQKLDVVGVSNLNGGMTLSNKVVKLDGVQSPAQQNLVFIGFSYTGSSSFKFQKYNNTLHLSGYVYGDVPALIGSRNISFVGNIPSGYTFPVPWGTNHPYSVSGGGCSVLGTGTSRAQYVAGNCYPVTATTYRINFNTGSGVDSLDLAGQTVLSFSVWFDDIA